jgi:ketosteroid isomerase-like protein
MDAATEMERVLGTFYAAITSGDGSEWFARLAPDVLAIGTDDAEWIQGKEAVVSILTSQLREMHEAGIRTSTPGSPTVAAGGDIVWAADRPVMHLPDGTAVQLRITMTASRENETGGLLVRQFHLSSGAPNEDLMKEKLTV